MLGLEGQSFALFVAQIPTLRLPSDPPRYGDFERRKIQRLAGLIVRPVTDGALTYETVRVFDGGLVSSWYFLFNTAKLIQLR
jgi:hypothetical protein